MPITPSGEPTVLYSEVAQYGCEVIVSITLKIPIFLEPEVVGLPPVCHIQKLNVESDVTLTPTDTSQEQGNLSLEVEVEVDPNSNIPIADESTFAANTEETWTIADWLAAFKQLIWRYLPEAWKSLLFERMPNIYQILAIG
ncbi:MAG TPA: hypothetical protein V6C85_32845 [Allocoleopsis sp.]